MPGKKDGYEKKDTITKFNSISLRFVDRYASFDGDAGDAEI